MSRPVARLTSLALACALLSSCSDDTTNPDSAVADAGDAGAVDLTPDTGGGPDQAAGDGPVSACDPALDITPLSLDASYCVVRRFALPGEIAGVALRGNAVYVFSLDASPTGKISQAAIDPLTGKPGAYSSVFNFTPGLSGTLFASAYLALSPAGHAAAGYTVDKTFEGQIFWGDKGTATPKLVDKASGNFDVVFLDNQTLLVNGAGAGAAQDGQGVYVCQEGKTPRLIKDIGVMSGFMALGKKVLFAGGYFTGGSKIYGFSLAEVQAAIAGGGTLTPAGAGDLVLDGSTGDATALGDDLVVIDLDSSWAFDKVSRIPVTASGNKLTVGAATDVVTGAGGTTLTVSGLTTGSGTQLGLVLQGATSELAIVEPK